jgi:hypothetical protein
MRVRLALTLTLLLITSACARPEPPYAAAIPTTAATPLLGVLFLINGRALDAGHTLAELDQRYISSVEHLIGPAAIPYLRPHFREVYLIATSDTATANRITIP